jgi:hypothetical protein
MLSHESPGSAIMSNSFNCFLVIISALGASDALAYSPVHGWPKTAMPRELAWRTYCNCSRPLLAPSGALLIPRHVCTWRKQTPSEGGC